MASLTGAIVDGVYTKTDASTAATASDTKSSTSISDGSDGTEYNQEMFLQLLVAEMQYQDPLEPTSNTEYVSELASFTQIEAIQTVGDQMQNIEADSLVGKYVIVKDDDGEYDSGKVDYVYNDNGELKLAINDTLYSIDQLDTVVDETYYNATITSKTFENAIASLPELSAVTLSDAEAIANARTIYDAMDSYTQGFVSASTVSTLTSLEARIAALQGTSDTTETTENTDTTTTEET